jgi:Raf kinase inhibitor-like YbhB/YbcL family protein
MITNYGWLMMGIFPIMLLAGCQSEETEMTAPDSSLSISSPEFNTGQPIPEKYTCDAENISPPLVWEGLPPGTNSLALVADDPDAPIGTWTHWIFYNIPPSQVGLSENISPDEQTGGVGTQGKNSFNDLGYGGPCPPPGKSHRYFFKLYALALSPDQPPRMNTAQLNEKMLGHILGKAEWMGTYRR